MKTIPINTVVIFVCLLVVLFIGTKGCEADVQPPIRDITDSLKAVIKAQIKTQDSLKLLAGRKDSVRVETIVKWRKLKEYVYVHDSIPCDSLLPIVINTCDSVIAADSAVISSLKKVIVADSLIIDSQAKLIVNDSLVIVGLNKDIKKHKKQKRWLSAALVVTTILAIVK
jgi:hypothetical protein